MNGTRGVYEEEGTQVTVQVVDGGRIGEEKGRSHFRKVVHQLCYGRLNVLGKDLTSNLDGGEEMVHESELDKLLQYVSRLPLERRPP